MKDIQKVLSSYKQRFISTSPRSRTYFLSVLDDKSTLDIKAFNGQFGVIEDIQESILSRNDIVFRKKKIDLNLVKKLLQELNEYSKRKVKEYIPIFTNKDFLELEEMNKVKTLLQTDNELLLSYTSKVFNFFLKEININITNEKSYNISKFILWEVKKSVDNLEIEKI